MSFRCVGTRRARHRERGNSLVLALVILTALGTLALLTVGSVRGGMKTTANDRFHAIAMYAAESGGAAAMEYLRTSMHSSTRWTTALQSSSWTNIPGNGAEPGDTANRFSADTQAWYEVEIRNNRGDPSPSWETVDGDGRVVIRATGHGPDGARAIVEWEVTADLATGSTPCRVYAMENQSEDNTGTNPCIGTIDTSQTATFTP